MAGADTRPPCRFYQVGQCRAGSICKFAHVKDSTNKLKIAAPQVLLQPGLLRARRPLRVQPRQKGGSRRAAAPVPARRAPAAGRCRRAAPRQPDDPGEAAQRVRAKLELDDALPMVKAIEKANAAAGLTAEGPLPAQVDRLLAALQLDDAPRPRRAAAALELGGRGGERAERGHAAVAERAQRRRRGLQAGRRRRRRRRRRHRLSWRPRRRRSTRLR